MTRWPRQGAIPAIILALSACGGGGSINSTPAPAPSPLPTPAPTPAPSPTPTPAASFDTAEYRQSSGPSHHGAITAYAAGASGAGVTVAVVDSGLSDPAGEFTGRISAASRGFGSNTSYADVEGHGTAVSAVLAAGRNDRHIMGMAWGATLMALRTDDQSNCSDSGCTHPTSAIASAIDHAWQNGARIINISLGGGTAPGQLLQAVSRATAAGTIIVVAAGNNPEGEAPLVSPDALAQSFADPAYARGLVIIASSVNENDTVSGFSAGVLGFETVSLAALGNRVRTIDHEGVDYLYTGTSLAAPQISGAAALLAQAFPNLSGRQIVDLLLSTARDVGAPGADARYGRGILDVAAAFAPQGQLRIAGTGLAVTPGANSALSAPMGDVTGAALGTVALDALARAYRVDLSPGFLRRGSMHSLGAALDQHARHVTMGSEALALSLNVAPAMGRLSPAEPSLLDVERERQSRILSGVLEARFSTGMAMTLGLRTGFSALATRAQSGAAPTFLMADHGFDAQRGDLRPAGAMALFHRLGKGFSLTGGVETGHVGAPVHRPGVTDPVATRPAPYHAVSMTIGMERSAAALSAGLTLMDEPASALGARFDPLLGSQSARTLFARLGGSMRVAPRMTLSANWQHGWTHAAAGGLLTRGGQLVSESWSIDLARRNLFASDDLLGIRIAQPLRVVASRFDLVLPDRWDWETQVAASRVVPLDLAPDGRERNHELSYARSVGPGWLGANLFLREQGGNIAAMPDDLGLALRWSARF